MNIAALRFSGLLVRAVPAVGLLLLVAGGAQAQSNSAGEGQCYSAMAKVIGQHTAASAKAMATCLNAVLDGTSASPCPDATAQAAIDSSAAKVMKGTAKACQSTCSPSGVTCIGSAECPPLDDRVENCTAGGKNPFEANDMGFPGAYCERLIGGTFRNPEDFGTCAESLGRLVGDEILANAYGPLDQVVPVVLTAEAEKCLASIVKTTTKTAAKLASTVASCRVPQLTSATPSLSPDACPTEDIKTQSAITKGLAKVSDAVAKSCTDSTVQELAICGQVRGATVSVADAQTCLVEMVRQAAYSTEDVGLRPYATLSVINAAFPKTSPARCGDGIVNQTRSQFQLIGEECDGADDDACPGECLPPGDLFQCTCGNILRLRGFAVASEIDLDTGWTGLSHNSPGTNGTGPMSTLTGCDCSQFGTTSTDAGTCIGTSTDAVCNVYAEVQPLCASRTGSGQSCDELGNEDGNPTDADCSYCDDFASNGGDYCTGKARFCVGGSNSGDRCNQPSDCTGGTCNGTGQCVDGPFAGNGCGSNQNCGICLGGTNAGGTCSLPANCPGGACEVHACGTKECIGGANSGNPCTSDSQCTGGRCAKTSDCLSQCYDADGVAQGSCWQQSDCAPAQVCRGRCNTDDVCSFRYNSAPLPLVGGGTGTCVLSRHMNNITGTRNIVTGESAINYDMRSVTFLAEELNSRPCPVCGGFCDADSGSLAGAVCEGNCTGPEKECRFGPNLGNSCVDNSDCGDFPCAAVACRFDSDCATGTCSDQDSAECRGGTCRLDLTCAGGVHDGEACRIEAPTRFGTTSVDCPPNDGVKLGNGLEISWTPLTSETVTLEEEAACNAPGYENYTCNCVDTSGSGSVPTRPNNCNAACNDSDAEYFARPCIDFTRCVGGTEDGAACDEDADCSGGGTCSDDPKTCGDGSTGACSVERCVGGSNAGDACIGPQGCPGGTCAAPACTVGDAGACDSGQDGACHPASCTSDANCDGGATCSDTCPAGRCVPLCALRGICEGGEKAGLNCVLDSDCAAGGSCVKDDPEEGACAVGSAFHCNGKYREFLGCAPKDVGTETDCEFGADGIEGNADDFPGAGICVQDLANCFVNDGNAEGGDIFNGKGDPTRTLSVATYCIPSSGNAGVDGVAGLSGPGRVRARVINIANISATP